MYASPGMPRINRNPKKTQVPPEAVKGWALDFVGGHRFEYKVGGYVLDLGGVTYRVIPWGKDWVWRIYPHKGGSTESCNSFSNPKFAAMALCEFVSEMGIPIEPVALPDERPTLWDYLE